MGHLVGKDIFRQLGRKIDGLEMRAPWNAQLHAILKELYSDEEADLIVRMPSGLSSFAEVQKATGCRRNELQRLLDGLTAKGLVMDLWVGEEYKYVPSPMVIGIFEFTMMQSGPKAASKVRARLFQDYLGGDGTFLAANFGGGEQVSFVRALPHEEALKSEEYVEILDYEKASAIIEQSDRFAIGLCSCRHEKLHLDEKQCDVPLEGCSQFGFAADFMIRHKLAREVGRSEMRDNFARSRELGLVLSADNVRKDVKFVCHCCACCCNVLTAVSTYGYPNALVTSTFLAGIEAAACVGCGNCAKACPIDAMAMIPDAQAQRKLKLSPRVDSAACLGCGVCALQCPTRACRLVKREQRVIHPETTFERVILQCLEKGTLQNQIFADPRRLDQKFLRALVGGFLRLPAVKKALMSDVLRSRFLRSIEEGAAKQGRGWVTQL
jgi:Na+-translocating ferredoxin:NAD+ oxidoreductase RNF subunit RnfB